MMENCILIADSGSTKTDWVVQSLEHGISAYHTAGINPVRDGMDAMLRVLEDELLPQMKQPQGVNSIHFYGAGCIDPYRADVKKCLKHCFPQALIEVESDLLGAARALCGEEPGIACILGTGSNSCLYDGTKMVQNVSPLGFILGDEGSGAVLGKNLLGLLFKGGVHESLKLDFLDQYELSLTDIIDRVYRRPQPNRFLASLVPFIHQHRSTEDMHRLLVGQFRLFLNRNVAHYGHPELPVNFTGSVAALFEQELSEALQIEGRVMGKILQRPIESLAKFHIQ